MDFSKLEIDTYWLLDDARYDLRRDLGPNNTRAAELGVLLRSWQTGYGDDWLDVPVFSWDVLLDGGLYDELQVFDV